MEGFITVAEAAKRCDVHPQTIRRWIKEGVLQGYRVGPRNLRVRTSDLASVVVPTERPEGE